jgi:hypothetical protein
MGEIATISNQVGTISGARRGVWPLIGLGLAFMVNAAWIGFLGYCLLKLV